MKKLGCQKMSFSLGGLIYLLSRQSFLSGSNCPCETEYVYVCLGSYERFCMNPEGVGCYV